MTGADDDCQVTALGREVERLSRRVGSVEALTRELHAMLGELADRITALAEAEQADDEDEAPHRLPSWLAVDDPALARALLADLADWLGSVYGHHPNAELPSCWLWHPAVVEELLWLRHAHQAAYEGRGTSWRDVGDWHDRQRPGVVKRIKAAIGDCELARHADGGDRADTTRAVPLATSAEQIAHHWTSHRATPPPDEAQLSEAEQHDRTQHRSSRR